MLLTIWLQYCSCWIIQKSQKCIFEWSKVPKRRIWANIWSLVSWIDLIMHTVIVQDRSNNLATIWHMLYHSKVTKMHFWMTQNAQKEDLCQYLEFCCLDRLDNAYCDITQCFLLSGAVTSTWRIIQTLQKCIFERFKEPKMKFLAILSTSAFSIWLIFDIVIYKKNIEVLIVIKMMEVRFKYAFIQNKKVKMSYKQGLRLLYWLWMVELVWYHKFSYMTLIKTYTEEVKVWLNVTKMHFGMIQRCFQLKRAEK